MAGLLFGTSGIPTSTYPPTTADGIRRIAALGLDCLELAFVHGVYLNKAEAGAVAGVARNNSVILSSHAPYYLNFNPREDKKRHVSQGILHAAARISNVCEATDVVFHPGFYMGDPPEQAFQMIKKAISEVLDKLEDDDNPITLRPEVSGKFVQFGTVDEIVRLTQELPRVWPCVDFAHWHARGNFNSYSEFSGLLKDIEKKLGRRALETAHYHLSGIEYNKGGERKHLPLRASDLKYEELLRAFKDYGVQGKVICESPNPEEDALLLKETYEKLS
jgi:deoxyribonuclease IV